VRPNKKRTNEEYNNNATIRKKRLKRVRSPCSHTLDSLSVWLVNEQFCHNFSVFLFFPSLFLLHSLFASRVAYINTYVSFFHSFIHHILIFSILHTNTRDVWKRSIPNVNYFISYSMTMVCWSVFVFNLIFLSLYWSTGKNTR